MYIEMDRSCIRDKSLEDDWLRRRFLLNDGVGISADDNDVIQMIYN